MLPPPHLLGSSKEALLIPPVLITQHSLASIKGQQQSYKNCGCHRTRTPQWLLLLPPATWPAAATAVSVGITSLAAGAAQPWLRKRLQRCCQRLRQQDAVPNCNIGNQHTLSVRTPSHPTQSVRCRPLDELHQQPAPLISFLPACQRARRVLA